MGSTHPSHLLHALHLTPFPIACTDFLPSFSQWLSTTRLHSRHYFGSLRGRGQGGLLRRDLGEEDLLRNAVAVTLPLLRQLPAPECGWCGCGRDSMVREVDFSLSPEIPGFQGFPHEHEELVIYCGFLVSL